MIDFHVNEKANRVYVCRDGDLTNGFSYELDLFDEFCERRRFDRQFAAEYLFMSNEWRIRE